MRFLFFVALVFLGNVHDASCSSFQSHSVSRSRHGSGVLDSQSHTDSAHVRLRQRLRQRSHQEIEAEAAAEAEANGQLTVHAHATHTIPHVPDNQLWPQNTVYYKWDIAAPPPFVKTMIAAMSDWSDRTARCIRFEEIPNDEKSVTDHVKTKSLPLVTFMSAYGSKNECLGKGSVTVGLGRAATRVCLDLKRDGVTNVDPTIYAERSARHELGHVLGLYEMMQRKDREKYIEVPEEDCKSFLRKRCGLTLTSTPAEREKINECTEKLWDSIYKIKDDVKEQGQFDYGSIMMYKLNDAQDSHPCIKQPTASRKNLYDLWLSRANPSNSIVPGITAKISNEDAETVRALYKCK